MFILDTDHLSILQQEIQPSFEKLAAKLSRLNPAEIGVTVISFQEQIQGWFAYLKKARASTGVLRAYWQMENVLHYFCNAKVLGFDKSAEGRFNDLRQRRIRIATLDLRIASIALASESTLLSRNLRDFLKVPGLAVEDWTR